MRGAALLSAMSDSALVEFYQLTLEARAPKRAERSGAGYLPSRAMRYCDAVTTATSYGYWVFPPMTFRLVWDGEQIFWAHGDSEEWLPLSATDSGAVQLPGFAAQFDNLAPDFLQGYSPPFLSTLQELGTVQIWTGLLAKTRPGWSLNVRAPVNLPAIPGLVTWEGVVETDLWFGPLFNNFRISKTNSPVTIRADEPFLQVQPVPQAAYSDEALRDFQISDPGQMSEADWRRLSTVLLPSPDREARQGEYAVAVRRRRLCPVDHRALLRPDVEGLNKQDQS